jgi:hypothetical protein
MTPQSSSGKRGSSCDHGARATGSRHVRVKGDSGTELESDLVELALSASVIQSLVTPREFLLLAETDDKLTRALL